MNAQRNALIGVGIYFDENKQQLIERHRVPMVMMLGLSVIGIILLWASITVGTVWIASCVVAAWFFRKPIQTILLSRNGDTLDCKFGKFAISEIRHTYILSHWDINSEGPRYTAMFAKIGEATHQITEAYGSDVTRALQHTSHALGFTPEVHSFQTPDVT